MTNFVKGFIACGVLVLCGAVIALGEYTYYQHHVVRNTAAADAQYAADVLCAMVQAQANKDAK